MIPLWMSVADRVRSENKIRLRLFEPCYPKLRVDMRKSDGSRLHPEKESVTPEKSR